MRKAVAIFFGLVLATALPHVRVALAAMSSSSFIVPSETLGDSGGNSTSASFQLNDTLGDIGANTDASSASFIMDSGFQTQTPEPVFTFTVGGGSSVTLAPAPTPTTMATATSTVTTSTNAPFGYTTTITDDGQLRDSGLGSNIVDVSDGTVGPVGTEEYGVGLTGADRSFADDRATSTLPRTSPATPRTIASSATFGANRTVTVTYKLTISGSTMNGTYAQVVTYISSPNY